MKILNTGGTFNKRYNPIRGELEIPFDNLAVEMIVTTFGYEVTIGGAIYKDSLEMTDEDREQLAAIIDADDDDIFVVIHGTDTMDQSAAVLAQCLQNCVVVLVGAMTPFSIEPVEASVNLGMALGFAATSPAPGVYICMNGIIAPHKQIRKNRMAGRFEVIA